MSKSFFLKFGFIMLFVVVAALWLASIIVPDMFGDFNIQWAIVIVCGGGGLFYLLRAFGKNLVPLKKWFVLVGTVLIILAVVTLINLLMPEPDKIIVPVIVLVAALGLLISLIATGGKKWDQGDNKNVGYKNYHQRKAEAEKQEDRDAGRK